MMFKYMLYRYRYDQAALHFAHLIKTFLYQGVLTANVVDISKHESEMEPVRVFDDRYRYRSKPVRPDRTGRSTGPTGRPVYR